MSTKMVDHAFVKAVATLEGHEIMFYAIAFSSEPDKQGDRIASDAADEWLAKFYAKGKPLPISYRHAAMLGESRSNPKSVVGYAPATPDHVFKDEHGIMVRAILYDHDEAATVYRLASDGVLTGASAVFSVHPDDEELMDDKSTLIKRITEMKEAGLCLDPANDDAYLVSVKEERPKLPAEFDADVLDLVAKAGMVAKAGRSISAKNEQLLRTALSMIENALQSIAAVEEEVAEESKAGSEPRADPNAWISEALASVEEVITPA